MKIIAKLKGDYGQIETIELEMTRSQHTDIFTGELFPNHYRTSLREKAWEGVVRANWPRIFPLIRDYAYPSADLWHGGTRIAGLAINFPTATGEEIFAFSATVDGLPEFTHIVFERNGAGSSSPKK